MPAAGLPKERLELVDEAASTVALSCEYIWVYTYRPFLGGGCTPVPPPGLRRSDVVGVRGRGKKAFKSVHVQECVALAFSREDVAVPSMGRQVRLPHLIKSEIYVSACA